MLKGAIIATMLGSRVLAGTSSKNLLKNKENSQKVSFFFIYESVHSLSE